MSRGKVTSPLDGRLKNNLTREQRSIIGAAGGRSTGSNRAHMAVIGRRGGLTVSRDRVHMAEIGKLGGRSK